MELVDELAGLGHVQVELGGEFVLAHAVHEAQADGLGGLAFDAGHVSHHLVEVRVRVGAVGLDHAVSAWQVQEARIVHQQPRFLG